MSEPADPCPEASPGWVASCPSKLSEYIGAATIAGFGQDIAFLGHRQLPGGEYRDENLLGVMNKSGVVMVPIERWEATDPGELVVTDPALWVFESATWSANIVASRFQDGVFRKGVHALPTPATFPPYIRAFAHDGKAGLAWHADRKYGVLLLDADMKVRQSRTIDGVGAAFVDDVALGPESLAVVRFDARNADRMFVDVLASDLTLIRSHEVALGTPSITARLAFRDGGFDVLVTRVSGPFALGRIGSKGEAAVWTKSLYGESDSVFELSGLAPVGERGLIATYVDYNSDPSSTYAVEVSFESGAPVARQIWTVVGSQGHLGAIQGGYAVLTSRHATTQFVTVLSKVSQ